MDRVIGLEKMCKKKYAKKAYFCFNNFCWLCYFGAIHFV